MNGWEWVIWGYTLALGGVGVYGFSIAVRTKAAAARVEDVD